MQYCFNNSRPAWRGGQASRLSRRAHTSPRMTAENGLHQSVSKTSMFPDSIGSGTTATSSTNFADKQGHPCDRFGVPGSEVGSPCGTVVLWQHDDSQGADVGKRTSLDSAERGQKHHAGPKTVARVYQKMKTHWSMFGVSTHDGSKSREIRTERRTARRKSAGGWMARKTTGELTLRRSPKITDFSGTSCGTDRQKL